MATSIEGTKAIDRVKNTRCHDFLKIFPKNPSITYCPAKVPVIVELFPAANKPSAHKYRDALPKMFVKTSAASYKLGICFSSPEE